MKGNVTTRKSRKELFSALDSAASSFVCSISVGDAVLPEGRIEVVRNSEKTQTIVLLFV